MSAGGARAAASDARLLAPGLALVAALDGWAARLLAPDAPSVSLFAPLALAVALAPMLRAAPAPLAPVPAAFAALLILAPSGALAWAALALVALAAPMARASRLLLLVLASAELLTAIGLNVLKPLLLPVEAALAAALLGLAGGAAEAVGNVVVAQGRLTIVAPGCSGLAGAVFAGLGALALLERRGGGAHAAAFALAAAFAFLANLVRLAAMAADARLHAIAHGQTGAFATDLVAALGVVGAVVLAERARR